MIYSAYKLNKQGDKNQFDDFWIIAKLYKLFCQDLVVIYFSLECENDFIKYSNLSTTFLCNKHMNHVMMLTETPVVWPHHEKSWLIGKDSKAGRDWGQEEKGITKDEMAGWHHTWWTWVWVNSGSWWWTGRPGVLLFMGLKESDTTELLNWTEFRIICWTN